MAKQGKNGIVAAIAVFLLVLAMVLTVVLIVGEQNPQIDTDSSYPSETVSDKIETQAATEVTENSVSLSGKYLWEYGRPANNTDGTQHSASDYSSEN